MLARGFFEWPKGVAGGSRVWGLLIWNLFSFLVGDAARRIFTRRDGFRHGLVMGAFVLVRGRELGVLGYS